MPRLPPSLQDRRRGLLAGAVGPDLEAGERALTRATVLLALSGGLDLGRLTGSWLAVPQEALPITVGAALGHLRVTGSPLEEAAGLPTLVPALAVLPLVTRTFQSAPNVVSGSFHVAALLDPSPTSAWAAVAVSVAAACFLQARRDFVADVMEALRANEAPSELLAGLAKVPIWHRAPLPVGVVAELRDVLWAVHHLPSVAGVTGQLAGLGSTAVALGSALAGARDGAPVADFDEELHHLLEAWSDD